MKRTSIHLTRLGIMIISSTALLSVLHADERDSAKVLAASAQAFLQGLTEEQRVTAQLPFSDEARSDWHYFPKKRKGIPWKGMTPQQKELSWAFITKLLSESGHHKVKGIVAAERELWEDSNHSDNRDPERYHFTLFGEPSESTSWGASMEGHHLSINLTVIGGKDVYVTPSFFGSNPDTLKQGDWSGKQPLHGEMHQALTLMSLLSKEQREKAIISGKATREIMTRARPRVEADEFKPQGLSVAEMNDAQKAQLMRLLEEYVGRYRPEVAQDDMNKISKAGIDKIDLIWAGEAQAGSPMYYRIQGPTFVMEYANTQNGSNHSHTVWRDFENDFGYDALKAHLEVHH